MGATVLIEGTSRGTVTDRDGRFVIPAEKKAKLVVFLCEHEECQGESGTEDDNCFTRRIIVCFL